MMNYNAAKNYIAIRREYDTLFESLHEVFGEYGPFTCLIEDLRSSLWDAIDFEEKNQYIDLALILAEKEFDKAFDYVTKIHEKEVADASSAAATNLKPAYTYRIYELIHKRDFYQVEVVYQSTDEEDAWDYFDSCCNSTHSYFERYYIDADGNTYYQEWNDTLEDWLNIESNSCSF